MFIENYCYIYHEEKNHDIWEIKDCIDDMAYILGNKPKDRIVSI